ncbi:MAG: ATP-binding protein [Nitrosopumilus sp.]|nr:ATP-binding protein [Nitrosopumilus sp.]MDA7943313.1 ATP-binding protein [Nitrosopumilus sp.]
MTDANPFTPGAGRNPPYLAGRGSEQSAMGALLSDLDNGLAGNILIYGLRGVGKTVLLNEFATMCEADGFLPVVQYQYSEEHNDPEKFFEFFKQSLDDAIRKYSKKEQILAKAHAVAAQMKPKKVGAYGMEYEPSYDADTNPILMNRIMAYISKKWGSITSDHSGVIFLFDEFHTMGKNGDNATLANFIGAMNELQRTGQRCSVILSGLPTLPINVKKARSYSERMFRAMEISNIRPGKAAEAITIPLKNTKWDFAPDLVDAVIKDTERYPYFIQYFSKQVIDLTDKNHITLADYAKIRSSIIEGLGETFFVQRIAPLSSSQKKVLYAMASMPAGDLRFSDIIAASEIRKSSLANYMSRLVDAGLVFKSQRGFYNFTLPLLRQYLLDAAPC